MRKLLGCSTVLALALAGCSGSDGKDGAQGPQGIQGVPGSDGVNGVDGTNGQPGVDGTDGTDGTNGTNGTNGSNGLNGALAFLVTAEIPATLNVVIQSVTIASPPVVNFTVKDAAGRGAVGIKVDQNSQATMLRFSIAKLIAGVGGEPNSWRSYINANAQATAEYRGTLVDHMDGSYTYTFFNDITAGTITYEPTLTHRVAIELFGNVNDKALPVANAFYDFVPAGGAIETTRDIAATASCNECHGKLAVHGGRRTDVENCVVCHNPSTIDPDTGNTVNMPYMIHAIHGAATRAANGLPAYTIIGFNNSVNDFSEVTYPQNNALCNKCHKGTDPVLPDTSTADGDNWKNKPNMAACGACHNVDWASHHGGQTDNSGCLDCHSPGDSYGVSEVHAAENKSPNATEVVAGAANFTYDINEVTVNGSNQAVVRFKIQKDGVDVVFNDIDDAATALDKLNYAAGADIEAPPGTWTVVNGVLPGFNGSPSFLVAYGAAQDGINAPADINNFGKAAAQPVSISIAELFTGDSGSIVADTGGYYIATIVQQISRNSSTGVIDGSKTINAAFPSGATVRTVALQGYFSQKDIPTAHAVLARHTIAAVKSVSGEERRQVVDSAKCGNCHEWFEGHGGNRVYNINVCTTCHNPNLTSSGRTATVATATASVNSCAEIKQMYLDGYATRVEDTVEPHVGVAPCTNAADTLEAGKYYIYTSKSPLLYPEASNNLKDMIHGIHASAARSDPFQFVRVRSGKSYYFNFAEVTFPGILQNCETCHKPGTYTSVPENVLVSTVRIPATSGTDTTADIKTARNTVPNATDLVTTPVAGACSYCHDSPLAIGHMEQNGGYVNTDRTTVVGNAFETCEVCHGTGSMADVAIVHE